MPSQISTSSTCFFSSSQSSNRTSRLRRFYRFLFMSARPGKSVLAHIDPKHPLTATLAHLFGGYSGYRNRIGPKAKVKDRADRHGTPSHVDIVDPQLCDDVLQYLAPTLIPYRGCTIIDANPGACLWTQKLHEFLQPRLHVLLEPDERYFAPFVQPLLNAPGSAFKHVKPDRGGVLAAVKTLLNDHTALPWLQHPLRDHDPRRRQVDTSVLVTGNLARAIPHKKNQPVDYAHLQLDQITTMAGLHSSSFYGNGLVRMLWWMPDVHVLRAIPHLPYLYTKMSMRIQMNAQVTQVVGVEPCSAYALGNSRRAEVGTKIINRRHPWFDMKSSERIEERMRESGIVIPPNREMLKEPPLPGHTSAFWTTEGHADWRSPIDDLRHNSPEELQMAINDYKERYIRFAEVSAVVDDDQPQQAEQPISKGASTAGRWANRGDVDRIKPWEDDIFYPQCHAFKRYFSTFQMSAKIIAEIEAQARKPHLSSRSTVVAVLLDFELRLINLEANYHALREKDPSDPKLIELHDTLLSLSRDLRHRARSVSVRADEFITRIVADHLAFHANPPTHPPDRRPYEPIRASDESFFPRHPLALVDVVPTDRDLSVPGLANRFEANNTARELINHIFGYKTQSLPSILDKIAPNAAQDLIPLVPALTDPRKGGRLNAEALNVKMMNEEMFEGLVKAWFEWPFRPHVGEMALGIPYNIHEQSSRDWDGGDVDIEVEDDAEVV